MFLFRIIFTLGLLGFDQDPGLVTGQCFTVLDAGANMGPYEIYKTILLDDRGYPTEGGELCYLDPPWLTAPLLLPRGRGTAPPPWLYVFCVVPSPLEHIGGEWSIVLVACEAGNEIFSDGFESGNTLRWTNGVDDRIFYNGFESGDTSAWSRVEP